MAIGRGGKQWFKDIQRIIFCLNDFVFADVIEIRDKRNHLSIYYKKMFQMWL